jgi:uncharacterized delta-60 repeat protein
MKIKEWRSKSVFACTLLVMMHLSRVGFALDSGVLDTSFGTDGEVITDISTSALSVEEAAAVATQSDGKIVITGVTSDLSLNTDLAVVRYNTDGSLDTTFGDNGQVTTDTGSTTDAATSIAIQADDKIVIAGTDGDSIIVVRYNTNGSLDTSFGVDGIVTIDSSAGVDIANAFEIQADDGKIVVGGISDQGLVTEDFILIRLNTDGSLDTTFDGDGTVTTDVGAADAITDIVINESNDEIIVVGTSDTELAVAVYDSTGTLDPTFSDDGILTTDLGTEAVANDVTLLDDEILVAGSVESADGTETDSVLVLVESDGTLDASFGDGGVVTADLSATSDDEFTAVEVTADGEILAAGDIVTTDATTDSDFVVVEYDSSGTLDTSFGTGGTEVIDISDTADVVNDMVLEEDGTIVLVGGTNVDLNEHIAVAVLNPDGSLDVNFDADGTEVTNLGISFDETSSYVAIQSDDKIVVVGTANDDATSFLALVRYLADGSLDTSFSADGFVFLDSGSTLDQGKAVAIQSDDKIIIAGTNGSDVLVARYDTDGNLDTTFGTDGVVITSTSSGTDIADTIAIQSDGKIVIGGTSNLDSANEDFLLIRYNTDGSLDTDFNDDGIVTTDLGGTPTEGVTGVAIESDGTIVAEGTSGTALTVVSYTSAGELNTDFSNDGVVQLEETSVGNDIALENDGDIVVAGAVQTEDGTDLEAAIVVLNTDGSLDTDFGTDGIVTVDLEADEDDQFTAIVIQENGEIIAGGGATDPDSVEDDDFILVAIEEDGIVDTSFGDSGIESNDFGGNQDSLEDLGIQSDGTIIGTGYTEDLEEGDVNIGIAASTPAGVQGGGCNCNLSAKTAPRQSDLPLLLELIGFASLMVLRVALQKN